MAIFGPVQLFLIGLENEKLQGQVSRELHRASEKGDIRVLDALAIQKTKEGAIISLSGSDLTPEQRMEYGAIVGALIGVGATGTEEGLESGAEAGRGAGERQSRQTTAVTPIRNAQSKQPECEPSALPRQRFFRS